METIEKRCVRCEEVKPLEAFHAHSKKKDGRQPYCRECRRQVDEARNGTFERKCSNALTQSRRKAKRYGVESTLTIAEVRKVLSGDHCDYCDKHLEQSEKTIEHVIPFESGGTNTLSNVTLACRACNSRKHTTPAFEFILLKGDATAARRLLNTLAERNGVEPQEYLYELARAGLRFNINRVRRRNGFEELTP